VQLIDLTGKRFDRALVLGQGEKGRDKDVRWVIRCACGRVKTVRGSSLRSGRTRSCGCIHREFMRDTPPAMTHGHGRHTYQRQSPEYRSWAGMIQRCINPKAPGYHRWGGRGITVCDKWRHSFEAFLHDMGPRPMGTSLDRIDNDGPYTKQNCRWATRAEQHRNQRRTVLLTRDGLTLSASEWDRHLGFSRGMVLQRLRYGWTPERALTTPPHHKWG